MARRRRSNFTDEFVDEVVAYFNENESTVRETAKKFGIGKSTIHNFLTKRRPNPTSKRIIEKNKAERHYRGGEATRRKYMKERSL